MIRQITGFGACRKCNGLKGQLPADLFKAFLKQKGRGYLIDGKFTLTRELNQFLHRVIGVGLEEIGKQKQEPAMKIVRRARG